MENRDVTPRFVVIPRIVLRKFVRDDDERADACGERRDRLDDRPNERVVVQLRVDWRVHLDAD